MKNKKWIDMDVDELKEESRTFKYLVLISLISVLFLWIIVWFDFLIYNNITSEFVIIFFAMLIISLYIFTISLHLNSLIVIKRTSIR